MFFINSALFFIIAVIIFVVAGYLIISKLQVSGITKFQASISYLGSLSVLLISYNIYMNINSNRRIEENRFAYNTIANVDQEFLGPIKFLLSEYPESFFLLASMYQDEVYKAMPTNYDPIKRQAVEIFCTQQIFQSMENFLTFGPLDITGSFVWLNNFLIWLRSPILQEYWKTMQSNFADDTRELVNSLIEKSNILNNIVKNENRSLVPADYDKISKHFTVKFRLSA